MSAGTVMEKMTCIILLLQWIIWNRSDDLANTVEVGEPHFNGSAALSSKLFRKKGKCNTFWIFNLIPESSVFHNHTFFQYSNFEFQTLRKMDKTLWMDVLNATHELAPIWMVFVHSIAQGKIRLLYLMYYDIPKCTSADQFTKNVITLLIDG